MARELSTFEHDIERVTRLNRFSTNWKITGYCRLDTMSFGHITDTKTAAQYDWQHDSEQGLYFYNGGQAILPKYVQGIASIVGQALRNGNDIHSIRRLISHSR